MKIRFASLLSLCAMLLLAGSGPTQAAGEVEQITKRGELRIGYIPSPPGIAKDPVSGEVNGFYVDAARAISEQMGVKPVFVESTWANFVAGLQSNQFDLSIAGTFATVKRAMVVDFSKPLNYLGSVALVRKDDNRFKELSDMNRPEIKIAVVQGTEAEDFVKRVLPKAKLTSLSGGNLSAGFIEVAAGRADASFQDIFIATEFAKQQPTTKVLFADKPVFFLPIAWAVKKGNSELLSIVNVGLESLLISGQLDQMTAKYIPDDSRFVDAPNLRPFPKAVK